MYLFESEQESTSKEERQREKETPHPAGIPRWSSLPGLGDHDLSETQMLDLLGHPGAPDGQVF